MFPTINVSYAFVRFLSNLLTIVFCSYINTLFDFIQGLEEQVAEFPVLKVKDVIKIGFKKDNDGMGDKISNMVKQTKASSGIIWNSFKELEQLELETIRHDIPAPCFLIPFAKRFTTASSSLLDQDRSFFPWLDQQPRNSVVFISFGSVAQVEEKHFMEMVHGLVDSK
ncbi:hypothetical protein HanRHA438_Chr14g0676671 [Helianthus annuus]|uniref:UDP-glucuronosyl/UDP-glucosyltransferase n=1 Tax=Helianthus annuus TaxID=4232 RepID=A0A9K3HA86_HELAN|nr:hypothetical protein HanXRQr2_Chr14g0665441 [Helianthus annuus]KAJ0465835.1 hypothetical protein HanHA300_Chr14g0542501 [Helianthus annuus]KAJ0470748.1 hypothetical protein HanIR_Chr14g0722121 [Helianthus annuus]KAJ0487425.1 hypothetical protein HanHA89_Chr14g0590241 [Helianthus annuus]KAJ0657868.1 hypothetical protein HanLR1_Chr14g0551451 [Helianthus annuus]